MSVDVNQTKRLTRDDAHNSIEPYTSADLNELFMLGINMLPLRLMFTAIHTGGHMYRAVYSKTIWNEQQWQQQWRQQRQRELNCANELSKKEEKRKKEYWDFDSDSQVATELICIHLRYCLCHVCMVSTRFSWNAFVMNFIIHVMADTFFFFDHLNDRMKENILQQNILIKEDGEFLQKKYETGFQLFVN